MDPRPGMATAASTPVLRMKLLIDTTTRRVLFAEAGKDVVDFLFSLLALPVATAVALVGKGSAAGSVGNLFASVEALDDAYVVPGADKRALLRPAVAATAKSSLLLLLLLLPPAPQSSRGRGGGEQSKAFFQCASINSNNTYGYAASGIGAYSGSGRRAVQGLLPVRASINSNSNGNASGKCSRYVTDAYGTACPYCGRSMTKALAPAGSVGVSSGHRRNVQQNAFAGGLKAGFVQGVVTYTVRDDLTVTPMSAISSITLLNTFAVTNLAALKEVIVHLGYAQGVEILRASLQSKTVLTDVFLGKQGTG